MRYAPPVKRIDIVAEMNTVSEALMDDIRTYIDEHEKALHTVLTLLSLDNNERIHIYVDHLRSNRIVVATYIDGHSAASESFEQYDGFATEAKDAIKELIDSGIISMHLYPDMIALPFNSQNDYVGAGLTYHPSHSYNRSENSVGLREIISKDWYLDLAPTMKYTEKIFK